ncbi:adenosylcobinamide-phosphate synthase CbiB [Plebeiibacterium sediminum]|uniref:Cobalamin biosynthesis protein CobD n=1 Tax=Plebeiibacterium sediminum TaxID=2992112 RepID=A0AAE3M8S5_9BACT|nr:adenosylcobinamide-phosphate synthase CbiB [Plebeiobacterium sediminum]MCW3789259.1 adenosylcobinamide-phosphate synthase CbiB [Plebeiobacterium sediminum]
MMSELFISIVVGFILDLLIGDPYSMPHPIKVFGNTISLGERYLNKNNHRKIKGAFMAFCCIVLAFLCFYMIERAASLNYYVSIIVGAIFVFYGLANRTLINEVLKVEKELSKNGLDAGRKQLSFIVGRQTDKLDAQSIRKAALETLSENLSDGVIAPLFYLFIGGIPLMFAYKMVNTLDSMIGYKNDRYKDFGCFAAKVDDVFNFIPARITALLIALVSLKSKSFAFIFKYGNQHSSPNAGYPEAALAGALNCRFGGPSEYFGKVVDKPYIGENPLELNSKHINYSCGINLKASVLFLVVGLVVMFYLG